MADETRVFREKLQELKDYARENGGRIAAGRIRDVLGELLLDPAKLQMVYAYLDQTGIEVYDPELDGLGEGGAHRPALESYLEELDRIVAIPEEMELKLFHATADGDAGARETLIARYLTTACDLAGEFERTDSRIDAEDLIQEANMGLILAMDGMEREETLAAYRVRLLNRITEYLEESVRQMEEELRGEARVLSRMNRLADTVHELEEQLEHKPSIEEVSAYLDLPEEEIRSMLRVGGENLTIEDI